MNKLTLALIFSTIVFIKGQNVDAYNTEPYYSFDWLDDDKHTFEINYSSGDASNYFCFLYNQSVACRADCDPSSHYIKCTVKGSDCKADGDNPTYKYYYSTYCMSAPSDVTVESKTYTLNKNSDSASILNYIKASVASGTDFPPSASDVSVTIAVCNGSFLKYSMILLSLLIL